MCGHVQGLATNAQSMPGITNTVGFARMLAADVNKHAEN